jgi:SPP1 gp7 family putative phage head morphogenesis protein
MARQRHPLAEIEVADDPGQFREAVRAWRQRVPVTEAQLAELEGNMRDRAFTVANVAQADLVTDVWEALDRAIAHGTTFDDFKDAVGVVLEDAWGGAQPGRLETIFRTNVQTAYNAGRYAQARHPAVGMRRPYWRFVAVEDARTSDICSEADGTVLPASDGWWHTHVPPLHHNCRSTFVPLTDEEAKAEGVDERGPDADADEGFGAAPKDDDTTWEPNASDYPAPVAEILKERLP